MENYISTVPAWLIILFIVSFLFSITLIAKPAKQAALNLGLTEEKSRNIEWGILLFYVLWLTYISALSLKGIFAINSMPPNLVVFGTLPLFVILFAIIGNNGLYKKLLQAASLKSLVRIHLFRLVGVFFIVLYLYKLLPAQFAFSAEMGDVLTALLAIPLAKAISQKKPWATKAVYAWNIFGILDILNILALVTISMLTANKAIITGKHGILEFNLFPFVWFPAFAPATILFLHYGVFKKLQQLKTELSPAVQPL